MQSPAQAGKQAVGERSGDFYHVLASVRSLKKSIGPELAAHGAKGVAEREVLLGISGGTPGAAAISHDKIVRPESDEGE